MLKYSLILMFFVLLTNCRLFSRKAAEEDITSSTRPHSKAPKEAFLQLCTSPEGEAQKHTLSALLLSEESCEQAYERLTSNDHLDLSYDLRHKQLLLIEPQSILPHVYQVEDVSILAFLPHLIHLDLKDNAVSDIAPLSALTNLRVLILSGNPLSSLGEHLKPMEQLTHLDISRTTIVDLAALNHLPTLTEVVVSDHLISNKVLDQAKIDHPSIRITVVSPVVPKQSCPVPKPPAHHPVVPPAHHPVVPPVTVLTPAELEEQAVGAACYIPGPTDHLTRPNLRELQNFPANTTAIGGSMDLHSIPLATVEDFIKAIQTRCKNFFSAPIHAQAAEARQVTRDRLLTNDLFNEIRTTIPWSAPGGLQGFATYRIDEVLHDGTVYPELIQPYIDFDAAVINYIITLPTPQNLWQSTRVTFYQEPGIDLGGLRRQFITEMIKKFKSQGIFAQIPDTDRWQINPHFANFNFCTLASEPHDASHCFTNIGKVIAKILVVENETVDINFSKVILNSMAGYHPNSLVDLLALTKIDDPDLFRSMMQVLSMPDPSSLYLDFTDLLPNGSTIDVNAHNIYQYVQRNLEYSHFTSRKIPLEAFLAGFNALVPEVAIQASNLNAADMNLFLRGIADLSLADLRAIVSFVDFSPVPPSYKDLFWTAVEELNNEITTANFIDQLMIFWTGGTGIPANQTSEPLRIHLFNHSNRLPVAHTCFNILDLWHYPSLTILKNKLRQAVELSAGFGLSQLSPRQYPKQVSCFETLKRAHLQPPAPGYFSEFQNCKNDDFSASTLAIH